MRLPDPPAEPLSRAPVPGAVLVLERWNSWVHVWIPHEERTAWVDLATTRHQVVQPPM